MSGPIVQAITRHINRVEIDPGFIAAESIAYVCGVLSLAGPEWLKERVWRHLVEDSTNDYTVALVIARSAKLRADVGRGRRVVRAPRLLAQREVCGFPLVDTYTRARVSA